MTVGLATAIASDIDERIATFSNHVEFLGVRVSRVANSQAAAEAIGAMLAEAGDTRTVASAELCDGAPELVAALRAAGLTIDVPADAASARDQPFGLSMAKMAVVETGSIMLAELNLADRAVGMLTETNVVICRTVDLRPSLEDAASALKAVALQPGGGYATLVTGPSRTADIEMSLTVGVQGPKQVVVLFVDELT